MITKLVALSASLTFTLLVMCPRSWAQTITLAGQLLTEDSLQPLPQVRITATSSTRPPAIIETNTAADGSFSLVVAPGVTYRLCSAQIDNYVDSCRFYEPVEITAAVDMPALSMAAAAGTRMRVRIIDPDGLILSPQGTLRPPDPLLLLVFAEEDVTQTRIPLQLVPSATVSNAVEAAAAIPNIMSWRLGISSIRAQLFDANGNVYQSSTPIPRPNNYGSNTITGAYDTSAYTYPFGNSFATPPWWFYYSGNYIANDSTGVAPFRPPSYGQTSYYKSSVIGIRPKAAFSGTVSGSSGTMYEAIYFSEREDWSGQREF